MFKVLKRDGRKVPFDLEKIERAILKSDDNLTTNQLKEILNEIVIILGDYSKEIIDVEEIQNTIINVLIKRNYTEIAEKYSNYRKERTRIRDIKSDLMKTVKNIGIATDRDNANVGNNFSSKLLRISSETNKWQNLSNMPLYLAKLHEIGDLYYHDLDSYNLTVNCLHIPTKEILERGFNTGYGFINPPQRLDTAATLSCILLQSSQNDLFGGQSHPDFDNDLAFFVERTRKEIKEEADKYITESLKEKFIEEKVESSIRQAMQGIIYNLNSMHSRAGSQVPFSSVNLGLPTSDDAALICKIFLEEYEKGLGKGEQPLFPNIIFRVKKGLNANKEDKYYYLYQLACRVASKRMNPTFMNIDADFNKKYYDMGYVPATMGCRTYIMSNINGEPGCKGRGNIAPVTINLPRIGIQAKGDVNKFFNILEERLELAKESLLHRYSVLKNLKVKDLPFAVGQGLMKGSEGLSDEDTIEPILRQGTWGIGFIGLAETLISLTGHHHGEDEKSRELGEKIVSYIRDYTDKITKEYKLNFSTYATPAEGLSGKFIEKDKKMFGEILRVTDKEYYTNSYHVPVNYPISIIDKINIEAPYHKLCNAGHISYIEVDDTPSAEVIESILNYAYNNTNINYLGINFHIRYCKNCGETVETGLKHCEKCGSSEIQGVSRVTGYLALDERFGKGKYEEKQDRLSHTGNHSKIYK